MKGRYGKRARREERKKGREIREGGRVRKERERGKTEASLACRYIWDTGQTQGYYAC